MNGSETWVLVVIAIIVSQFMLIAVLWNNRSRAQDPSGDLLEQLALARQMQAAQSSGNGAGVGWVLALVVMGAMAIALLMQS